MIINPKIKEMFTEIEKETIRYMNTIDGERNYLKRLLFVFKNRLTEDEQLYVFKTIFEFIHYKNIITDPDNILQLHNIRMRTYAYVAFLLIILMIIAASIFKVNDSLAHITTVITNVIKILTF